MSDMTKAYGQIINIVNNKAKSCLELTSFDGYCKAVFAFYYNDGKNASEKDAFKQLCETVRNFLMNFSNFYSLLTIIMRFFMLF